MVCEQRVCGKIDQIRSPCLRSPRLKVIRPSGICQQNEHYSAFWSAQKGLHPLGQRQGLIVVQHVAGILDQGRPHSRNHAHTTVDLGSRLGLGTHPAPHVGVLSLHPQHRRRGRAARKMSEAISEVDTQFDRFATALRLDPVEEGFKVMQSEMISLLRSQGAGGCQLNKSELQHRLR